MTNTKLPSTARGRLLVAGWFVCLNLPVFQGLQTGEVKRIHAISGVQSAGELAKSPQYDCICLITILNSFHTHLGKITYYYH